MWRRKSFLDNFIHNSCRIYIHVETEKLHLFDRGTEKSLGYPEMVIRAQEKLAVPKLEKAIAQ